MKKLTSLLLALTLICAMLPVFAVPASAASTTFGTLTVAGEGTEESPYKITDYKKLNALAAEVNAGNYDFEGVYFVLPFSTTTALKTPIGTEEHPFKGNFDGNGSIVWLDIDQPDKNYVGLFGYAVGSEIKNVYWQGRVAGHSYVGGVCGYLEDGSIINCGYEKTPMKLDASVTGSGNIDGNSCYIGGICGCLVGGELSGCSMDGKVINNSTENNEQAYTGGVCGYMEGDVSNCTCAGSVTLDKNFEQYYAGGICGYLNGDIENCSNSADVYAAVRIFNEANGTPKDDSKSYHIGGICGFLFDGACDNCINSGDVTGGRDVGGICGAVDEGYIVNAANKGIVTVISMTGGGICGNFYGSSIQDGGIINCVNKADIHISDGGTMSGGIAGSVSHPIVNCINTGGPICSNSVSIVGGVVGLMMYADSAQHSYCNGDYSFYVTNPIIGGIGESEDLGSHGRELLRSAEQLKAPGTLDEFNEYISEVEEEIPQLNLLEWVKDEDGFPCLDYSEIENPSAVGSVLSAGNLWIIIGVAVLAVIGAAALVIVKKKKPALADGNNSDEE